jgi:GxxExxY protein
MLSSMQRTSVFKFKSAKSNIEYIKKRIPSEHIKNSSTPRLSGTMQKGAEVAVDRFIRSSRSMSSTNDSTQPHSKDKKNDITVTNVAQFCQTQPPGPSCRNPLCYYNRRTNVVQEMKNICEGVYDNWGPGYTEATYEQAIVNEAYNRKIPLLRQASIDVTNGGCSVHAGRIDLEVDGRYLYELKARDPAMDKDRSQISKYIRAYAQNGKNISRAFLVFFTEKRGVIFEEISCDTHGQSHSAVKAKWSSNT